MARDVMKRVLEYVHELALSGGGVITIDDLASMFPEVTKTHLSYVMRDQSGIYGTETIKRAFSWKVPARELKGAVKDHVIEGSCEKTSTAFDNTMSVVGFASSGQAMILRDLEGQIWKAERL